jgi:hypothetical protein
MLTRTLAILTAGFTILTPLSRAQSGGKDSVPIYSIQVVSRALKAVNYEHRGGPTHVNFKGTVLLPRTGGEAKVEVKNGYTEIDATFKHVEAPSQFGTEFLTYVVWAITPDGHSINLGELIPDGTGKGKMRVTCPYSTFGLLVTAEPYFSVPYPSDLVVMENVVRKDTVGRVEDIEAKADLLPRKQYTLHVRAQDLPSAQMTHPASVSEPEYEAVLELYQARNAVQIARADGAPRAAPDMFRQAQQYLDDAEAQYVRHTNLNAVTTTSRQAVQKASDARAIALKRNNSAVRNQ